MSEQRLREYERKRNDRDRKQTRENDRERTPTGELQHHVVEEAVSVRFQVRNLNCTDNLQKIDYFCFFFGSKSLMEMNLINKSPNLMLGIELGLSGGPIRY